MSPRKHEVPDELLSSLLANYQKPEDLVGENGLLKQLTKMLVEKALNAEMTEHLGHQKHEPVANASGNTGPVHGMVCPSREEPHASSSRRQR